MSRNVDPFDKFCKVLRALVFSSPVNLDLLSLERHYQSFVGQQMPLEQFGYKTLLAFLQERCSDLFVLDGEPHNPVVVLNVPKTKSQTEQKLSAKDEKKRKRWKRRKRQPGTNDEHNDDNTLTLKPKEVQTANEKSGNIKNESDKPGHSNIVQDSGRSNAAFGCNDSTSAQMPAIILLAEQLTILINDYPEGLSIASLKKEYRKRYGMPLRCKSFGVSNDMELLRLLEDTVFHLRRLDMWFVYDVRRPPPPDKDEDPESSDGVMFNDTVLSESVAAFKPLMVLDVIVGGVYTPSTFWILRQDDQHSGLLYVVMDAMATFYNGEGAKLSFTDETEVRKGVYCAARYNDEWHRARVLNLTDPHTVLLRYIDYGTVARVPINSLKPLLRRWGALPAQAIRAKLSGVLPPSHRRHWHWPHTSSAEFMQITMDKAFIAQIFAVDYEQSILEIFLVDTSAIDEAYVHKRLIQKGLAVERFDFVLGLLDKFERYIQPIVESYLTLCYAIICKFIQDLFSPIHIDSYRQYVLDDPLQLPAMQPSSDPEYAPSNPSSSCVRGESRSFPTFICLMFGKLLQTDYVTAVELALFCLQYPPELEDVAVSLTFAEHHHLEYLRSSGIVVGAAVYLDKLIRERIPPAAGYPTSPPLKLLVEAVSTLR